MAVSSTQLTTASSGAAATSYATASVSPAAYTLILLTAVSNVSSGSANHATASGAGLTFTEVRFQASGTGGTGCTLLRATSPSPSAGAITIDYAGQSQVSCHWSVTQFANVDISGTNAANAIVQSAGNTN